MERLRSQLVETKAKSTDKVTLCIDGDFPVDSDAWHDWWRSFRASLGPSEVGADKMLCFISGGRFNPPRLIPRSADCRVRMPSVQRLIGFDKDAFCSYGLDQSANAAMSEEMAKTYQAGLNDLIRHHSAKLGGVLVVALVPLYHSGGRRPTGMAGRLARKRGGRRPHPRPQAAHCDPGGDPAGPRRQHLLRLVSLRQWWAGHGAGTGWRALSRIWRAPSMPGLRISPLFVRKEGASQRPRDSSRLRAHW